MKPPSGILNMLWMIDLYLALFSTSGGIYSIPKESKQTVLCLSIYNKTQVFFTFLSSIFITYAPPVILGKYALEKTPLHLRL